MGRVSVAIGLLFAALAVDLHAGTDDKGVYLGEKVDARRTLGSQPTQALPPENQAGTAGPSSVGAMESDEAKALGEQVTYVSKQVRRETKNEQHPSKTGSRYDRDLPMGVVK